MKEIVLQNFWFIIFAMAMLTLVLIYIVLTLIGYKPKDAIKPMLAAVFYIAIFVLCGVLFVLFVCGVCRLQAPRSNTKRVYNYYLIYSFNIWRRQQRVLL